MQPTKIKEGIFRHSQAFYENQIAEHLSLTNDRILYEVKIFFHDETDKIPIGTKISFEIFEGNNSKNQLKKQVSLFRISIIVILICQKTSLQLPVDIFPYLNGSYATDNIAKITP